MQAYPYGKILFLVLGIVAVVLVIRYLNGWREEVLKAVKDDPGRVQHDQKVEAALKEAQKQNADMMKLLEAAGKAPPKAAANDKLAAQAELEKNAGKIVSLGLEAKAIAKAKLHAARSQAKETEILLDRVDKEATGWETRTKNLLAGDEGKRLAASKTHVEQVSSLVHKERMNKAQTQALREQLLALMEPVAKAEREGNSLFLPGEAFFERLDMIAKSAREAIRQYENDRSILETLVADRAGSPPGDSPLKQAVDKLQEELNRKRAEAIAEANKTAFDEGTKKIAAAQADATLGKSETEAKRIKVQAEGERALRDLETQKEKLTVDHKILDLRFKNMEGEVKSLLSPLISHGFTQPGGHGYQRSNAKGPVSLSAMRRVGWLEKTDDSLQKLCTGNQTRFGNDRPMKDFPQWGGAMREWGSKHSTVLRVQNILREFGPLMVEKGLLAP